MLRKFVCSHNFESNLVSRNVNASETSEMQPPLQIAYMGSNMKEASEASLFL